MPSRSSMTLMIRMVPRHFGQVRGSIFPDQVGDRLPSSGLAAPSSSGIHSSFYRLPEWWGPRRLHFFSFSPENIAVVPKVPDHLLPPVQDVGIPPGAGPATLGHR